MIGELIHQFLMFDDFFEQFSKFDLSLVFADFDELFDNDQLFLCSWWRLDYLSHVVVCVLNSVG
jgi:hypothetical protein